MFQQLPGVLSVTSGYMGGATVNPTYEQICGGDTGHAEVSRIVFDTTQDQPRRRCSTRSGRCTIRRRPTAKATMWARNTAPPSSTTTTSSARSSKRANRPSRAQFRSPIVTEILPVETFYPAENYHQDYYNNNKNRNPYCAYVITPKLNKMKLAS